MKIECCLKNIATFEDLLPIVEEAKPQLSCFGARFIHLSNCGKNISIDSLARRMIEIIDQNPNFTEEERLLVRKISDLIDRIYDHTDKQVSESWFFTRLFVWIRDLYNSEFPYYSFSSIRWNWRESKQINMMGYNKIKFLYTKDQFLNFFRFPPDSDFTSKHGSATFNGIPRWYAPNRCG